MQFVKSSVYQAEITEGGVREREVDTRSREEVELQERLRKLPEFSRNPNFKSYAEQVWEGLPTTTPEAPASTEGKQNPNLPHSVTEEEFEFYEALRAQDRRKKLARQREEDEMRDEFHKAREASLRLSVSSARERRSSESESSPFGAPPKLSPFAALGAQKQRTRQADSPLGEGSIFDVTTKVFKEKQQKRAIDARRTFNLIIKKRKCGESSGSETTPAKAADSAAVADKDSSKDEDKKEKKEKFKPNGIAEAAANAFASLCEAYGDSDDSG
ncbi:hypothetical protein ACSSS7_007262 [Eimeria intestinalis]